ncbi:hypothetical protein PGT21_008550 [Puccinia graminis f. sp. tritici]|nr:hypothetical protein PGT21_008550 [Puccinia graminis f. sp. tritici]
MYDHEAERRRYSESVRLAERLGHPVAGRRPTTQSQPRHMEESSPRLEPFFGGFVSQDQDEHDLDNHERSIPIAAHAEYFRLRRYAEKRHRISCQWGLIDNQALATYLLCQQKTLKWTQPAVDFASPLDFCTCASINIHHRRVDLVDLLHRRPSQLIAFCKCTPDPIRLMHHGYFACSVEKPRSAFSIRLVQYHHLLWQASAVSTSAFIQSISTFLDNRSDSPLLNRGSNWKRRQLRVPFTNCIDLYRRILNSQRKLLEDGLQLTKADKWASKCPRCFGPSQTEIKQDTEEPDVIVAMDGNFQQRHYAYASKDEPREDQYPHSFLPPSKISSDVLAIEETEASAVGINPPCSDQHKAANDTRDESTWDKCDDNGLFASTC